MCALALLAASCAAPDPSGPVRPRNVLLVSIDTCRADRLGAYGHGPAETPNLDALAAAGARFERAVSPAPLTLPAHSSMLTGTYPSDHGVRDNFHHRPEGFPPTLAERLGAAGYTTAAFVASFVMESRFGLDRGFSTYDDGDLTESSGVFLNERDATTVTDRALAWLAGRTEEPFFAFVHYFDPHAPYAAPDAFSTRIPDPYDAEIAYVDHELGRLLDFLDDEGLADATMVLVTADHGESLGEHGEPTHGYFAYQSTLRVPLVVRAPGHPPGKVVREPVSLVDIVPTVLAWAQLPAPDGAPGVDLAADPPRRALYAESLYPTKYGCAPIHAVVHGDDKYIRTTLPELYHLGRDPSERENLFERAPAGVARLEARLDAVLARSAAATATQEAGAEEVERLRALGYLGGGQLVEDAGDGSREDPKTFLPSYRALLDVYAHFAAGARAAAREALETLLAERDDLLEAWMLSGDLHASLGEWEAAAAAYSTYLDRHARGTGREVPLDYDVARVHARLAEALLRTGAADRAAEHRRRARALDPASMAGADARDLSNHALELVRAGDLDQAESELRRAIDLDARLPEARYNLGTVLHARGDLDAARDAYRAALELDPGYAKAMAGVGLIDASRGRWEEAVATLRAAVALDPIDQDLARALARVQDAYSDSR